jgi:CRP/FNR family cyclic AMP-dependent transcriptional regulator
MILQEVDLFKGIDHEIMKKIVNICSEETYAQNTVLFRKGEEAGCLYILEEGTVKLVIENGGTITFGLDEPGEVFGWSSMVESGRYTSSGVCVTDVKALKIESDELDKIFNLHPDVGFKVLKRLGYVISRRLTEAYQDLLSSTGADTTPSYG